MQFKKYDAMIHTDVYFFIYDTSNIDGRGKKRHHYTLATWMGVVVFPIYGIQIR